MFKLWNMTNYQIYSIIFEAILWHLFSFSTSDCSFRSHKFPQDIYTDWHSLWLKEESKSGNGNKFSGAVGYCQMVAALSTPTVLPFYLTKFPPHICGMQVILSNLTKFVARSGAGKAKGFGVWIIWWMGTGCHISPCFLSTGDSWHKQGTPQGSQHEAGTNQLWLKTTITRGFMQVKQNWLKLRSWGPNTCTPFILLPRGKMVKSMILVELAWTACARISCKHTLEQQSNIFFTIANTL